jgi:hypothetical protein
VSPPDILREVPAELHTQRLLARVPRPGDQCVCARIAPR